MKRKHSALVIALTVASLAFITGAGARIGARAVMGQIHVARPVVSDTTSSAVNSLLARPVSGGSVSDGHLRLFQDVYRDLKRFYYRPVNDDSQLAVGAIRNMIAHLDDPYTEVLTPEQLAETNANREGVFHGIGAVLERERAEGAVKNDFVLTVVAPIKGSPGEKAGLRPGDVIHDIAIGGDDYKEVLSLAGYYRLIPAEKMTDEQKQSLVDPAVLKQVFKRAEIDISKKIDIAEAQTALTSMDTKTVKLKVMRDGKPTPVEIEITPGETRVNAVTFEMANKDSARIGIAYFTNDSPQLFRKAAEDARAQGANKLILDLRGNPGGSMQAGRTILGMILGEQTIAVIENRNGDRSAVKSIAEDNVSVLKVTDVLVDMGTARVSEVVSGALRDVISAGLFGQRTFGDPYDRASYALGGPDDGAHITIVMVSGKMLTPKNTDFAMVGLRPDEIVVQRGDGKGEDLVLRRALDHRASGKG